MEATCCQVLQLRCCLLYYDDYDMKLLKPMQLIAEKLNINLVRNDDIAPILTTESKVNNTLIKF